MQLSKQEGYALRLALDLATHEQSPIHDIAARQNIPAPYLGKIVQALARAGVVSTARGPRGGVRLAGPARGITIRAVMEAAQGPIALSRCLSEPDHDCPTNNATCPVRVVTTRLQQTVTAALDAVTLADLVAMDLSGAPVAATLRSRS